MEAPAAAVVGPLLFGRYQVERELGRGGMGRVLLAFDTKLRIHVAVKLVPDQLMADPEAAEDLRREVLRGIALMHPGIVRTHTFEQDESGAAIVMEYIDGLTFTEFKEHQPARCFDPEELLPWLTPLCAVLDYAHRDARLVHRDLKPRNIMVTRDGRLKVADFGISATLTDSLSRNTREGSLSGTPAYMSPQQARGKKPSHLDDVYSLGATIYDLISGKPPFFRGSMDTILMQVACEPPPLMRERREELEIAGKAPISELWEQTVAACLAKEPVDRPQSCAEVLARLQGLLPAAPALPAPSGALVQAPRPQLARSAGLGRVEFPSATPHVITGSLVRPVRRRTWIVLIFVTGGLAAATFSYLGRSKAPITPAPSRVQRSPETPPPAALAPAAATKEAPFANSLGMKFVPVPITGGPTNNQRVLFSVWETRVQDYEAFAKETGTEWPKPEIEQSPNHPAVKVRWPDAVAFCIWLTERERKEGRLDDRLAYRLPSDHEWSCAVGIGEREDATKPMSAKNTKIADVYPWGTDWPPPPDAGNYCGGEVTAVLNQSRTGLLTGAITGFNDGVIDTSPVGTFPANRFGLHDMGGNVWEWVADPDENQTSDMRTLRGAAWIDVLPQTLLSSKRFGRPMDSRQNGGYGFRCVLAPAMGPRQAAPPAPQKLSTPAPVPLAVTPSGVPKPLSEIEKWLMQVEAIYQPKWQIEVVAPYEGGLDDLKKTTLSALDAQIASASRAARLHDALAFRNERQRIGSDQGVSADDSDSPPAPLKTLRATWRSQSARLETERRQHAQTLFAQYDKVLATNQAALTQRQRLDDALQLQQRRDALAKEWLGPPPVKPATATKERPFVNSLGMKFVPVPGTNVLFCIHETRRRDYAPYSAEIAGVDDSWKTEHYPKIPIADEEDHPACRVNWDDARRFCAWLSKKEARTYRLPTDREWSFAVGIGEQEHSMTDAMPETLSDKIENVYPWGNEWPPPMRSGNFSDQSRKQKTPSPSPHWAYLDGYDDGFPASAPVMSFEPNKFGLYDLAGNAWEWCEDWMNTAGERRVTRGEGFAGGIRSRLLSSHRHGQTPTYRLMDGGFRCVLVSASAPSEARLASTSTGPAPAMSVQPAASAASLPVRATAAPTTPTPPPAGAANRRADTALAKATKDAPFVNSLGMKFVPVPGTKVLFCIHETRRQDYAAYAAEAPGVDGAWKDAKVGTVASGHEDQHPVVSVNWDDAQAFCTWLSNKEGHAYRLPTDEEWSWSVGIGREEKRRKEFTPEMLSGKVTDFPWGSQWPPPRGAGNFADSTWHDQFPTEPRSRGVAGYTDGFATTAPVMSFQPNNLNIYDLAGNVWEWVAGWGNESMKSRVLRGGSFLPYGAAPCSSARLLDPPTLRRSNSGFRCVVELPGP